MKIQLINVGRGKVTRQAEVKDEDGILREVRKHLMSPDVEIEWDGNTGKVIVGGFREVGEVALIQ